MGNKYAFSSRRRKPLYNFVRTLYITFLFLGAALLLLILVADIALAVGIKIVNNDQNIIAEDKENATALLKLAIYALTSFFVAGVFKQVSSWGVIKRNSVICLALALFFDLSLVGLFVTIFATEHTGAELFSVLMSFCALDGMILIYLFLSRRANDMFV